PPFGRTDRPRRTWEYVFWFAKTTSPFVDLRACGNEMIESRTQMIRPRRKAHIFGETRQQPFEQFRSDSVARVTDMIHAPIGGVSPGVDHAAMFPPRLADHLVRTFSPQGGLVADPMMGSGTTLLAARDAGRHWWGCDIVPEYVSMARRRMKASPK
ncbi:MAG: site-specific DNA-methyltransferase, partial [Phycisphaerae bacterium]